MDPFAQLVGLEEIPVSRRCRCKSAGHLHAEAAEITDHFA
jgi:hypothetical protein